MEDLEKLKGCWKAGLTELLALISSMSQIMDNEDSW